MKIDFLEAYDRNNHENGIFRIYNFDSEEVKKLLRILDRLIECENSRIDLGTYSFVHSIGDVRLILECGNLDSGISRQSKSDFVCTLLKEGWENAIELLKPFAESNMQDGFQWLYDLNTTIELLVSGDGKW